MFVEVKVIGQPQATTERETDAARTTTLRAVLTELVAAEVAAYETRRAERTVLRVLTPDGIAEGIASGKVDSGGRSMPAAPTVADAVSRAVEAFDDRLVYAFLDGRQLDDLDTEITVEASTRLRLVRLVALAGG